MCVYMNDRLYVWVFAFIKSALKILATTCRIDERKSQVFPFESISRLSASLFMTSSEKSFLDCRRNDFLAVGEMNWMTENWFGLVCWVLWHINLCRLFNAKSILM